ncbi:MAG: AbrB/MazE/SpoVT family DNA-binding domain-containing protein [Chloroflexi bacterium]|nr:AbrB/MazE/SpoVT family DNA-binding domain-containing protein [Chloroflexota bacterium]
MSTKVGSKGQVVIDKEIRDRLGIQPGWIAIQRLADNHVELYFVPPRHRESLKGSLTHLTNVRISTGAEWEKAREQAWNAMVQERLEKEKSAS